ncbi:MAG: hypothetical protein KC492_24375, partial [Myxococcales bacterium]|nr:hypothetical protein [Myxococcales bacterium]
MRLASAFALSALSVLASCEPRQSRSRAAYPPAYTGPPAAPQANYAAPPPQNQGSLTLPGSRVVWSHVPPTNAATNPTWGPTLTDIVQRRPARETTTWPDEASTAHELTHSIGFELRLVASRADRRATGFYVLGGRAAILREPGFRKAQVAALIPPSLRRYRYDLYLAGQPGWDDRPLYVWDEWN